MNIHDDETLRLFVKLLDVPAASGREERIAEVVTRELEGFGYQPVTDGDGNVTVRLPGRRPDAPLVCIAAHMDEIGGVVTKVEADGTLGVGPSGGLLPWKIGECPVEIAGDGEPIIGVLSMGSAHGGPVGTEAPGWGGLKVITGLCPEALSRAGVWPGSSIVPTREARGPVVFGDPQDPLVAAWTFDDRMGVVMLLRLLKALKERSIEPLHPTIVAFTAREETGCHGAKALAAREKPETFIAVDGCPMPPGAPLTMDSRPGIWSRDSQAQYDRRLLADLLQIARQAGTQLQPVAYESAANDASAVYSAGGAQRIACLGHLRENSHGYEVARLSVFENLLKTLVKFMETWAGQAN